MASVGAQTAYATDIFAVQRVYYHQYWSFGYQWMMVMSTQLIGFSIGGVARRFLVAPPSMSQCFHLPSIGKAHPQNQFGQTPWSHVPSSTPFILRTMPVLDHTMVYHARNFLLMPYQRRFFGVRASPPSTPLLFFFFF